MIIYYTLNYNERPGESRALLSLSMHRYREHQGRPDIANTSEMMTRIRYGRLGKPYIPGEDAFSISHSGNCWAVLYSENSCGLDVQYPRSANYLRLAARFYRKDEFRSVQENGMDEFFRIWVRREAYRKARGESVFSEGESVLLPEINQDGTEWKLRDLRMPIDIYAAACVQNTDEIEIERLL